MITYIEKRRHGQRDLQMSDVKIEGTKLAHLVQELTQWGQRKDVEA
jgi:hypothetical protein